MNFIWDKVKYLILVTIFITTLAAKAQDIHLQHGRISIIDLGSLIKSKALVLDKELIRAYPLSGLSSESDQSIIAIQGLKESGETDLTVRTEAGIKQFHVILGDKGEDLVLDKSRSRSIFIPQLIHLKNNRLSIVSTKAHINEYVLAGNPHIISLKQVLEANDHEFLKNFALSSHGSGKTDVVVATKAGVYKFTIQIGGQNNEHNERILLGDFF